MGWTEVSGKSLVSLRAKRSGFGVEMGKRGRIEVVMCVTSVER